MKNTVAYLFFFFLATLIFYGGGGINFISYCCGDCRTEGVEVLLEDKCCEVHGHDHQDVVDEVDSSCQADESSCCDLLRVSFDWNKVCNQIIDLHPAVFDLLSFGTQRNSFIPDLDIRELIFLKQESPPILCPRIYLSLLNTLLI